MATTTDLQNPTKTHAIQQAMSDYITSMSHDLKTPLVAIVGIGEILKNELKGAEHQKLLSTLENATNTVLSLVKDILSVSRIESGHLQVLFEPFDLLRLIEGVVSTMSHQCLEKGVELLISYPPELPRILISDSSAIRRIIINLLSNAIKFTDHGHITIKAAAENLDEKELRLNLSVEDTGIGIPENCLNGDFENALSINLEDEHKHQGAGLTIAIVKQLVQGIGGNMQINSRLGKGAKFNCSIPFALKKDNLSYLAGRTTPDFFKILVISDSQASHQIIEKILENNQVEVCSSLECLSVLKRSYLNREYFEIVLVDDKLMNPTLLSIAHKAKAEHWTKNTLFIYSSFPLSLTQMDQVNRAGFHEIISKPIQPSQLIEQIQSAWGKYIVEQHEPLTQDYEEPIKKLELSSSKKLKEANGDYHILLVEDNPIAGYITQCILEGLNCNVELVTCGVEALKIAKANRYDIIFLDIDLPDIDGITLCRILRTQVGLNQHSVIIALSGQVAQNEAGVCIAAGMNTFLEKPASSANFTQIIQQFLIKHQKDAA